MLDVVLVVDPSLASPKRMLPSNNVDAIYIHLVDAIL